MKRPLFAILLSFAIFSVSNVFSSVFFNIFIWQQGFSLANIALFQFISFCFIFIGVLCGAYLMRWISSYATFMCSSLTSLMLYLIIYFIPITQLKQLFFLGVLNGLYIGLFFAGFNLFTLWYAKAKQLIQMYSGQYIINASIQVIFPLIIGWLIMIYGFHGAFRTAIALILVQNVCIFLSPSIRLHEPFRRREFLVPAQRSIAYMGLSASAFGFFFAFIQMSISIFIFIFLQNEWELGEWNSLFAILSILTYLLLGQRLVEPIKDTIATLGVMISTLMCFVLFFQLPITLLLFNTLVSVSLPMLWVPSFARHFQLIHDTVQKVQNKVHPATKLMQLLVYREFFLTIGKLAFILLLYLQLQLMPSSMAVIISFLCFMPAAIFVLGKKAMVS